MYLSRHARTAPYPATRAHQCSSQGKARRGENQRLDAQGPTAPARVTVKPNGQGRGATIPPGGSQLIFGEERGYHNSACSSPAASTSMSNGSSEERTVFAVYSTRRAAEVAQEHLKDEDIEAFVQSDDAGGMHPQLQRPHGRSWWGSAARHRTHTRRSTRRISSRGLPRRGTAKRRCRGTWRCRCRARSDCLASSRRCSLFSTFF